MKKVRESQFQIVAKNRIKQDDAKENVKWSNSVKNVSHIVKRGILYDNILYAVPNLLSANKTT